MDMWSRIGNLFPRKRSVEQQAELAGLSEEPPRAKEPDHHEMTEDGRSKAPTLAYATALSGEEPAQNDASIAKVLNDDTPVRRTHPGASADPWLAARRRPLTYAHKLRLDADELESGAKLDAGGTSLPVEAIRTQEPTWSTPAQPEATIVPTPELEVVADDESTPGDLERNQLAAEEPSGSSETAVHENNISSNATDLDFPNVGEQQPEARQRFAMLRAVAQQWRPAVLNCRYLAVIGSTAEARKLAPVIRNLRREHGSPDEVRVCVAGDRMEHIRESLGLLRVSVDMEINFSTAGISIDDVRTGMITGFGKLLMEVKPEWLLVQGESVTAAMASIAAWYAQIPVAHLDAGTIHDHQVADEADPAVLHRRIASLFASIHFADTALGKEQLVREGVPEQHVLVTGNTGVDAMQETCAALGLQVGAGNARASGVVHVLVIAEMPDTITHGLQDLCLAVRNLATSVPGLYQFVWPVVGDAVGVELVNDLLDRVPGVLLSGPAGYEQYLRLLNECDLVVTDVEDVQEDAPSLGKPVLLMQHSTSRPEAQRAGITTLTGNDAASIQAGVRTLARKLSVRHGAITNPYGDGRATARIIDFFEGRQVLEFGRTALPRLLGQAEPPTSRLLPRIAS